MMGGVAVVITSMLLLLWFLDNPYHSGVGWPAARRRWNGRSSTSTWRPERCAYSSILPATRRVAAS